MVMKVFIPSRGRYRDADVWAGTLKYFDAKTRSSFVYVVPSAEVEKYFASPLRDYGVEIIGAEYSTIDQKRLLIGKEAAKRSLKTFMMLDDDLSFLTRRDVTTHHQRMSTKDETADMLGWVEKTLKDYPSVGLSAREANGLSDTVVGEKPAIKECYRLMRAVAFRTDVFLKLKHCRVPCMEDHDLQLQILSSGMKNACLYWWASGQQETGQRGGCSAWRTVEVHDAAAQKLAGLWPGIVKLRSKVNKTGSLQSRTEVTISWQRAYKGATK